MSTTFDVYPQSSVLPTFGELLTVAKDRFYSFLKEYEISHRPLLDFDVRDKNGKTLGYKNTDLLRWNEDQYAWFFFQGIDGGIDTYYNLVEDIDSDIWEDEKKTRAQSKRLSNLIDKCLKNGYFWSFRRSMGQPGIIALAYGYIAASLAELTDGIIYSDDSAWDYARFPCTANEFYGFYFRPDKAIHLDFKNWSLNCIRSVMEKDF